MKSLNKHPYWKVQHRNYNNRCKSPIGYSIFPTLRSRRLKFYRTTEIRNHRESRRFNSLMYRLRTIQQSRNLFQNKKKRYFSNKYELSSIRDNDRWYKAIDIFYEIYDDRNNRYELYFTQGIVDPYSPEANTYVWLTKT